MLKNTRIILVLVKIEIYKVVSSSKKNEYPTLFTAKANNTINGLDLDNKMMDASRF